MFVALAAPENFGSTMLITTIKSSRRTGNNPIAQTDRHSAAKRVR